MGRGVIGALLAWVTRSAARAGAGEVAVPCVLNERNVPLRLALTGAGFRAKPEASAIPGGRAGFRAKPEASAIPGGRAGFRAPPGAGGAAGAGFRRGTGGPLPAPPPSVPAPGESPPAEAA